ncbi:MAG: hypothetical protein LUQ35_01365 [Methanoregula sp.]|nr:hypothetical protein [Methanoregula sp.]
MKGNEEGASELIDETLIIAMGLVLAVVTLMLISGVIPLTEKTAYLVPQFGVGNISGHTVITIFNRGGEPVYFNGSPQAKYKAELYVNTLSGSYKAVPAPALTVFKPGDTIYAYYTGSGFILTNTLFGATFPSLPGGKIVVTFVDATSGVLIAKGDLVLAATTTSPTATATPATTTTTGASTTTVTATATATSATATAPSATSATATATSTTSKTATATSPTPKPTCPPNNPHCNDCPGPWPWC